MIIIEAARARAIGLARYFTGRACVNGHLAEHYTTGGGCVECANRQKREKRRSLAKPKTTSPRQLAIAAGVLTFNSGKPCHRGHFSDRYVKGSVCIQCSRVNNSNARSREREADPKAFAKAAAEQVR